MLISKHTIRNAAAFLVRNRHTIAETLVIAAGIVQRATKPCRKKKKMKALKGREIR